MDGPVVETPSIFIGIDVPQSAWDVHILPEGRSFTIGVGYGAVGRLLVKLGDAKPALVVIEATSGCERRLVAELLDAGWTVAVVNPRQARDFAKALGWLAKTDPIDARTLALFAERIQSHPTQKTPEKHHELDALVTRRRQLVEVRSTESMRKRQTTLKVASQSIDKLLKVFYQQIAAIEKAIARLIESNDDWRAKRDVIESTPGLSSATSSTLVAELPELGQLNRKEIASLVGLAPFNHDSGAFRGQRRMRGERGSLRMALHMAALTAMRYNPLIRNFAQRLRELGKATKVVITACVRKLLTILNTTVCNRTPWNPQLSTEQR